jgi:methylated-DNA-[protein]-cysteine S-methyltransferase
MKTTTRRAAAAPPSPSPPSSAADAAAREPLSSASKRSKNEADATTAPPPPGKPNRPPTPFERRVYALCSAIPRGRVSTYGGMAAALSPRGSARAVGQAMRRNPFAPRVPCHRVIAASRLIGGFSGEAGPCCGRRPGGGGGGGGGGGHVSRKRALLRGEGVRFESESEADAGYWVVARLCVLSEAETARLLAQKG